LAGTVHGHAASQLDFKHTLIGCFLQVTLSIIARQV